MNKKKAISIIVVLILVILIVVLFLPNEKSKTTTEVDYIVNLTDLTYQNNNITNSIKRYSQDEFTDFLNDYNSNNLPDIYITDFLFDGVSMYKTYDLDDFVEYGNNVGVKSLEITNLNINKNGSIELTGEIKGGMISVNTNNRKGNLNIILNNVNIDTDSKKVPAILIYNKDITSTDFKVTIETKKNSKNYIEGGKLKKVSLIGSDELANYASYYTNDSKNDYTKYTNYYGVYTKEQINSILFAKVQADNEDLQDGDPYYFYKGAGAISSDIDLNFEGKGYLEVTSKNKEGIETKGNLTFTGGKGDYVINALDDCINTTTTSKQNSSARNTLTINVNTLTAIVDAKEDAEEGDAIDSNGELIINGGTILAIAHPGQDAGIDSENGIYINGGTILATGDMYDEISSESKQNFIVLSFQEKQNINSIITILDSDEKPIISYKTDRIYTNLVYSSPKLENGTYYLYKDGIIEGTTFKGLYTTINNYTKGTQLGYSSTGMMQMPGNKDNNMNPPDTLNSNFIENNEGFNPRENDEKRENIRNNRENMTPLDEENMEKSMDNTNNDNIINKEFVISTIANIFNGISQLTIEQ